MLDLPKTSFIINTYLGNVDYEGNNDWGNYFYILCDSNLDVSLRTMLTKHPQYIAEYDVSEDEVMYIYSITEEQRLTIVKPFLRGEYSKINSEYFYTRFKKSIDGKISLNWRIYHKDPKLRRDWEERLDTSLPEDAEVWAKPFKNDEVYSYDEQLETV